MINRWSGRRLAGVTVVLALMVTTCVVAGYRFSTAARTDGLPQTITVDGIVYERAHLVTFRSYPGKKRVSLPVSATSRPIMVRAACQLPILRTRSAVSALMVETGWMHSGGSIADIPDTEGNEYLICRPGAGNQRLTQTIDPSWLPRTDDQRQLIWHQLPTIADAPSDAPASWALAVYTAG